VPEPAAEIDRLSGLLASWAPWIRLYDAYYEGQQPIRFMARAMVREFGERITALVINWPRLGVDAYENRLDIEGFRYAGDSSRDDELWSVWQANNCDELAQQGHLESLALSRSYVAVGSGDADGDPPLVTIEHPLQAFVDRDPRTRLGRTGIKRWTELDGSQWATLYLPDSTGHYRQTDRGWVLDGTLDEHNLSQGAPGQTWTLPLRPLVNRPRTLRPDGVSEFHDVLPLADAANKIATDMMLSAEYHAMPRRWAVGLKESDFVDEAGNQISPWSITAGHVWSTEQAPSEVSLGQFPESSLDNFHNTIRMLAQLASQTLALPPHYMSFTTDNPASADAIRSSETQLVKRVERKQVFLGGAWEDAMRLVLRFQTGAWEERARSLETMWRDPSTPTVAQKADAVVKLASARGANGVAILPVEQAREDLGYTPEQRRRMAEMDAAAANDPQLDNLARQLIATPPAQPTSPPGTTGAVAAGQ
jgi:hypothetical protein